MSLDDLQREQPFTYRSIKGGSVQICYKGRVVATKSGRDAVRFLARVEGGDDNSAQLIMAKATGHFKQGNERVAKRGRTES